MNDQRGQASGKRYEKEHEKAVVGTAALRDRHEREPRHGGLYGQVRADEALRDGGKRIDEYAGQNADEETKAGEKEHRGARVAVRLLGRFGRGGARTAKEGDAERLDETGGGERR